MPSDAGRLESINVSRGGVPKTSVLEARLTERGVSGDKQVQRMLHGGRDRAVVLFSLDVIELLQLEGHPIRVGRDRAAERSGGDRWTVRLKADPTYGRCLNERSAAGSRSADAARV